MVRYLTGNVDGKSLILKNLLLLISTVFSITLDPLDNPCVRKIRSTAWTYARKKTIRMITGQAKTAPSDSLFQELQVPTMKSVIDINFLKSRERALRLPVEHPRRTCLDREPLTRIRSRYNCRSRRINLSQTWPDEA